ncbi:TonB-dependent receptor [Oleiharenicola lentus]|nr:TonB-dependent receptor [Oleiharenicola lentus]
MQKSFLKSLVLAVITGLALTLSPSALAQLVSSGLTGTIRGSDGNPVAGASVTAVYTPTNATFTAVTNAAGRFNFRGLPVGGPYTLTASSTGYADGKVEEITAALGTDIEVNLTLKSDVLQLEKLVVGGDQTDLDASATGSGTIIGSDKLGSKPTSERSLADMISASPLVTLRDTFGDREESQITAVGQNNRYNSIQIDGSRINDMFGLNATGLASFFNPLSLDTLEQLAVAVSPYDVRQAGFTGASINAVTKSGTNKFKGSVYYYYRSDSLGSLDLQGNNPREETLTGAKFLPRLDRETIGATLGGPIIKDKLFFFVNYEKFESTIAGRDALFAPANEQQLLDRLNAIATASGKSIDWGSAVTGQTANTSEDEKITAKLDWQINSDHRATLRYTTTEGVVPQFGNFANNSINLNSAGTGNLVHTPEGHFYSQTREEKTIAGQINSQWTPNFKTEIRYSSTTQDQLTPLQTVAPIIQINGISGTNLNTNTAATGTYVAGTEQFRHGNEIGVDSTQMGATGDYFWGDFVFTGGFEREQTDFYNLFRQGSFGIVHFSSLANFLTGDVARITRNVYDPNVRNVADLSDLATTGVFGQARWDVNSRLTVTGGLRYEFVDSSTPTFNPTFFSATGFRNDGTPDGTSSISPRVGFNLSIDDDRKTQVRGGVGHFFGRAPWVIFSNSYGQTGVGSGTLDSAQGQLPTSLVSYLRDHFDPAKPIGTYTDNPAIAREVNWVDDGTELPQSWRANLAFDHKMAFLDSMLTAEIVHSRVDQALFVTNENLRETTIGADGRQRFAGAPSNLANRKYSGYTAMIRVRNTDVGDSTYFSIQWSRPVKNKWGFDLAYTRGSSTEAQSIGQTTAGGQWFRNAVFNQNKVENGRSDFEIRDRIQLSLTRQFEFVKNFRTTASLYYEGRSGNPYSWVFNGDLNGDGTSFNDRVAIPTDVNDPRFDFAAMPQAERDAFFAFIDAEGLSQWAGGIAPKNSHREPWVNRLDLKLVQDIPVAGFAKMQLFFDFVNFGSFISKDTFGYTELAPNLSNGVFRTRTLTSATSYTSSGRIAPRFATTPAGFAIDNGMSRWRIQLGAKILF